MSVASPGQARQAQISRFLLVLGPEEVLALSKNTTKAMSMVLYTSPEVGYIVMDSSQENNTNDVYGICIWYFC